MQARSPYLRVSALLCVLLVLQLGFAQLQALNFHTAQHSTSQHQHSGNPQMNQITPSQAPSLEASSCLMGGSCCGFWVTQDAQVKIATSLEHLPFKLLLVSTLLHVAKPPPKQL